ncbi:MAG: hypothetical protein HC769_35600, partial [Cyanobacteria bacterium CRU_2_1]|nr:hypothetical protein [Cyanobacteria bacterium CRU_2_1]
MQIARHLGEEGAKSDRLSDFSLEQALRQVQKRLPSVDGYTFDEVKAEYDTIKPDCFKFHSSGEHPYTFEIQGFTACFNSLTQAMNRLPVIREKYGRIANYQSVDVLPEPAKEAIAEAEVERVASSGWIQTKDGRNLNPRHYEVIPGVDAIAQVLRSNL